MTTKGNDVTARASLARLLTVEDLEELLRVNRRTIARLCKRGQLPPPLKLGGSNRWRAADIAAAIDSLDPCKDQALKPEEMLKTV